MTEMEEHAKTLKHLRYLRYEIDMRARAILPSLNTELQYMDSRLSVIELLTNHRTSHRFYCWITGRPFSCIFR